MVQGCVPSRHALPKLESKLEGREIPGARRAMHFDILDCTMYRTGYGQPFLTQA